MRLKDRNIMKREKLFKRMAEERNLLLAALRYYTSAFFRHVISSSQQNIPIPSGACLRHFERFLHGKSLSWG
jgi:hypothetical protein